ncbi:MAG: helix-turn-helix domain-containing protein [Spirulina sp. SIO3F2]|nr:helix-turn-helix domain-containing protein [Spirulina sp. SIO3F2]
MSRSIKVHSSHIDEVKQAVKKAGFKKQQALAEAVGVTRQTVNRFLNGTAIDASNFFDLCECLDVDWAAVSKSLANVPVEITHEGQTQRRDWGNAPEVDFSGHDREKEQLSQWIVDVNCRVITITGIARIGKTCLVSQVARAAANQFEFVLWRSVKNRPEPTQLFEELSTLIKENEFPTEYPAASLMRWPLDYLKQHRCLIILNQMESIMQPGEAIGKFRAGYEAYGELLKNIGGKSHQSTVLLIGQEPLRELTPYAGDSRPIRHMEVAGLCHKEARKILAEHKIHGSAHKLDALIDRYDGHPLFLRIAAQHIRDLTQGNIDQFLAKDDAPTIFNGLEQWLDEIFARLSHSERTLINWLAISFQPVTESYLHRLVQVPPEQLRHTLLSLKRRGLIKLTQDGHYEIAEYLREYLIYKMRQMLIEEIRTHQFNLFGQYPLVIAQSEDKVREGQQQSLVSPILKALLSTYGNPHYLEKIIQDLLETIRAQFRHKSSYAAANLLTLLKYIEIQFNTHQKPVLQDYEFSDLMVKQADLREIGLQRINFTHADLSQSIFYEPFAGILSVYVSQDGQFLAAGDASQNVYVWKLDGRRFKFYRRYQGHTHWVRTVVISPSGRYLASGSEDHTVRVWNLANGESMAVLKGHERRIRSLVFTADKKYLISAGDDGTVVLWNTKTWRRVGTYADTSTEERQRFREVVFDAAHNILIAVNQRGVVHFWNITQDPELQYPEFRHCGDEKNLVRTVAIHPEGHTLATGSDDGKVTLWRFPSGELLQELSAQGGQEGWIRKVIFNQDGSLVASSSESGDILVWETQNYQLKCIIDAHSSRTWEIAFSPDGKTLISGSDDRFIKLWDLETGECLTHLQGYTCRIRAVAFSPDGQQLVSGSDDQIIRVWNVESGDCVKEFAGHKGRIWAVAFYQSTQDELYLLSGSDDRTVKIWDINTGHCLKTVSIHTSWVRAISSVSGHPWILSGGDDKVVRAYNFDTREERILTPEHKDWILSVVMTSDGQLAVSGSDDNTVKIWDVATGECIYSIEQFESGVRTVAIDSNNRWCAAGGKDKTIRLFDLTNNYKEHPHSPLQGHNGWVRCVAFHPNAKILASGGYDQNVRVWDLETGKVRHTLRGHNEAIISVAFSPDGQTLATGSEDETIKLWETETGKLIRTISMPKPYAGLNITGALGISPEQRQKLMELGAIDEESQYGWCL